MNGCRVERGCVLGGRMRVSFKGWRFLAEVTLREFVASTCDVTRLTTAGLSVVVSLLCRNAGRYVLLAEESFRREEAQR